MSEQWALQSYDTVKLQFQDTDLDRHKGELCFALHRFFGRCEDWSVEWHMRKGIRLLFKIHLFGLISNFKQEEKFKITHIFDLVVLSSMDLLQMLLKANFLSRRDSLSAGSGYTISSWKSAHSIIRRHRILHTVQARSTYQSRAHYSLSDNCTSIIFLGKWFRWDAVCVIRPVLLRRRHWACVKSSDPNVCDLPTHVGDKAVSSKAVMTFDNALTLSHRWIWWLPHQGPCLQMLRRCCRAIIRRVGCIWSTIKQLRYVDGILRRETKRTLNISTTRRRAFNSISDSI